MKIRKVIKEDLVGLLELYTHLHDNPMPEIGKGLSCIWDNILQDKNHHIIVAEVDNKIVSSCVLVIIPNLTHNQRPYAVIENVVTDKNYRNQGFASACLNLAKQIAKDNNCYKIMLLTGSKDESILNFYRIAGFNSNDKTAFIQWL